MLGEDVGLDGTRVPAAQLHRVEGTLEIETRGEAVQHVELVKRETVAGDVYDVWDVVTDKDRFWVLSNLTNLYSQKFFPSLDFTISFHVGLMLRMRSGGRSDLGRILS